jgi:hypothetical protein
LSGSTTVGIKAQSLIGYCSDASRPRRTGADKRSRSGSKDARSSTIDLLLNLVEFSLSTRVMTRCDQPTAATDKSENRNEQRGPGHRTDGNERENV